MSRITAPRLELLFDDALIPDTLAFLRGMGGRKGNGGAIFWGYMLFVFYHAALNTRGDLAESTCTALPADRRPGAVGHHLFSFGAERRRSRRRFSWSVFVTCSKERCPRQGGWQ